MSKPGQQSVAHEYNQMAQCIHCGTYRSNVELLSLECTAERESTQDRKASEVESMQNEHGE